MDRAAYHATLKEFIGHSENEILGALVQQSHFPVTDLQRNAWLFQIRHLQALLPSWVVPGNTGSIHFEYAIPRMGRRIDVLLLLNGVLFVLEYKVGETHYSAHAYDQVMDYALDLKNFHETSHHAVIAPILIATNAKHAGATEPAETKGDRVLRPMGVNASGLAAALGAVLAYCPEEQIESAEWAKGRYQPTPTIIEGRPHSMQGTTSKRCRVAMPAPSIWRKPRNNWSTSSLRAGAWDAKPFALSPACQVLARH